MEYTLAYTFLLLIGSVALKAETSEDYLPRSIRPNEDSMSERPPAEEQQPLSFASSLKPVEFQYLVALDAPETSNKQHYHYVVENSDQVEDTQEYKRQPTREEMEAVLKKYFGSKSKYMFDKDQVGSVGKASRFRRGVSGASSSSYASSSYGSGSVDHVFPAYGSPSTLEDFFRGTGVGGGLLQGPGFEGVNNERDDGLHMRFGASDDPGTNVRGVYSGASSSIDNNGKTTYVVKAGKF